MEITLSKKVVKKLKYGAFQPILLSDIFGSGNVSMIFMYMNDISKSGLEPVEAIIEKYEDKNLFSLTNNTDVIFASDAILSMKKIRKDDKTKTYEIQTDKINFIAYIDFIETIIRDLKTVKKCFENIIHHFKPFGKDTAESLIIEIEIGRYAHIIRRTENFINEFKPQIIN